MVAAVGLIRGWRWVYAVCLVGESLQVRKFLAIDSVTALRNLLVVGLIASSRRYFSPSRVESVMVGQDQPIARNPKP